jgi:methionyl-tRNA formyltransferase
MKIIFLGTPGFAVPSLDILVQNGYEIPAVITAPDKPAGRGQKLAESDVKKYAVSKGLNVLQPVKLGDPDFLETVKSLKADLQIVVAFRMMPEKLWAMPPLGTFNLHGSLLPQYRGAAPINRAVMNGELFTGVTTFFLKQEIDTGNIVFRERIDIGPDESAGELHDRMMMVGAELVLKTVKSIEAGTAPMHSQDEFVKEGEILLPAPKIFKQDALLDFTWDIRKLHNHVRGLSPFPGAYFNLQLPTEEIIQVKVLRSSFEEAGVVLTHELLTDHKTFIKVSGKDGFLHIHELQIPGKKRMKVDELLRGFRFPDDAVIC